VVAALVGIERDDRVLAFADLIERGLLGPESSSASLQDHLELAGPRLAAYRAVLQTAGDDRGRAASALQAAVATAALIRGESPLVEVARTGPESRRLGLRTTGNVARQIIDHAHESLLLVGYRVTVDPERTGLAARTIEGVTRAAARGVVVTAILHREPSNFAALTENWPRYAKRPALFTWPEKPSDEMAKLHAKVVVADRKDALVTSANLTYHGFEANIELGIRVTGAPASDVEDHFHALIRTRQLVAWRT
jgi:phosphatidylserine/phosphatidylglycerophosphate/cardiolipin synthase-like enzyme